VDSHLRPGGPHGPEQGWGAHGFASESPFVRVDPGVVDSVKSLKPGRVLDRIIRSDFKSAPSCTIQRSNPKVEKVETPLRRFCSPRTQGDLKDRPCFEVDNGWTFPFIESSADRRRRQ